MGSDASGMVPRLSGEELSEHPHCQHDQEVRLCHPQILIPEGA